MLFGNDLKLCDIIQKTIADRRSNRPYNFDGALNFKAGDILIILF
jgi:hypothetical protein